MGEPPIIAEPIVVWMNQEYVGHQVGAAGRECLACLRLVANALDDAVCHRVADLGALGMEARLSSTTEALIEDWPRMAAMRRIDGSTEVRQTRDKHAGCDYARLKEDMEANGMSTKEIGGAPELSQLTQQLLKSATTENEEQQRLVALVELQVVRRASFANKVSSSLNSCTPPPNVLLALPIAAPHMAAPQSPLLKLPPNLAPLCRPYRTGSAPTWTATGLTRLGITWTRRLSRYAISWSRGTTIYCRFSKRPGTMRRRRLQQQ